MNDIKELKDKVEAILFAAGRMVSLSELSQLTKTEEGFIKEALRELKQDLDQRESPLLLTQEEDGWKLTVGEKHLGVVKDITPHMEMGKPVLETLAVIAWKQPVIQSEVVDVRGSGAYEHISELTDLGFLTKEKHGRSYLLKTTEKFNEYFDLPDRDAVKQIFKDVQKEGEEQRKITDVDDEKVGDLEVYEAEHREEKAEEPSSEGDESHEDHPHIDGLEIYEEDEGADEDEDDEGKEGIFSDDDFTEEKEEPSEEPDNEGEEDDEEPEDDLYKSELDVPADEERTRKIVEEYASQHEPHNGSEPEEDQDKEEKRKLNPELEKFAEGDDQEEDQ